MADTQVRSGANGLWRPFFLVLLAFTLTACRPTPPPAAVDTVKLYVDADGLYQVTATDLAAVGFDLAGAEPAALALSTAGAPVALEVVGAGRSAALRFYGQGLGPESYLGRNVYWLCRLPDGTANPERLQVARRDAAPVEGLAPAEVITATVRVKEQKLYRVQAEAAADRWVWQTLFAPVTVTLPLQAPHAAAGEAVVRVRVIGNSSAPVNPDHHLIVSLNGAQMADFAWDGLGPVVISGTAPAGVLRAGENQLTLVAPGDTGAPADSVALDWAELTYRRALVVDGGELAFAGNAAAYALRTEGELAALWDVTDPARPVALAGAVLTHGVLRFRADALFRGDASVESNEAIEDTARRFIAVTAAGLAAPAAIVPAAGPDLRDWPGGADMIVVTVPEFRPALAPLVAARQAQGLRVAVVDVGQVYDSFAHGRAGPEAIRALVRHARSQWLAPAPRFLLLAGDASYDPRGYTAGTERDLIPTRAVHTTFSGWTGSDVWYALPDDDPGSVPALAVGRFPAQTAEELAVMVAKTLDYERGPAGEWRARALLIADNEEPAFAVEAEEFAAALAGYTARTVTLDGDGSAARQQLLAAFADGTGLIGYFGHGSVQLWAQEKIFGVEDVAALRNRERLPVLFTVTCLSGFFEHPTTPSLGEALLRAKNGGAVAALVPSSAALLNDQRVLAAGLAEALAASGDAAPRTLGEAVLQAQSGLTAGGGVREILLTFNLLGDPALPR